MAWTREEVALRIDHALLQPGLSRAALAAGCQEALELGVGAVCVPPCWVEEAARRLRGSPTKVVAVVAFPRGDTFTEAKRGEALQALRKGAAEIDMVANLGYLLGEEWALAEEDIRQVVVASHSEGALVKVIIETALLSPEQIRRAAEVCLAAEADFVKTSTGFGPRGASVEDVRLLREVVGGRAGIKAAGGIRTWEDAVALLEAGANRLGASRSREILQGGGP